MRQRRDGHQLKLLDGGKWYYLDGEGIMKTGWIKVGGGWFHSSSGVMSTGWLKSGAPVLAGPATGAMATGTRPLRAASPPSRLWRLAGLRGRQWRSRCECDSIRLARRGRRTRRVARLIMTAPAASRTEVIDDMVAAWNGSVPLPVGTGRRRREHDPRFAIITTGRGRGVSPS